MGPLTRRRFVAAGLGAAGALAAPWLLSARRGAGVPDLATDGAALRRLVVLGPAGTMFSSPAQDYRAAENRRLFRDTGTVWVRLWADWPTLMPARGRLDQARMAALDDQIARARRDGLRVILTTYRFPTWANGIDALTPAQLAATAADRRTRSQPDDRAKSLFFRYPDDVSPASDWGKWIHLLAARYGRRLDGLEIASEPNHQWWPQQAPSTGADPWEPTQPIVHLVLARMLATAQAISDGLGGELVIMGPGTADGDASTRLATSYADVAELVLAELDRLGFAGGANLLWTHHNYADVTYDQGAGTTAPDVATNPARAVNRAADTRRRLVGRWAGWPAGHPADPQLFITEGGATLETIGARYGIAGAAGRRAKQADLLRRNRARMASAPEGAGIGMVANYLFYSDPAFDCGLCDPIDQGGARRPALDAWRA